MTDFTLHNPSERFLMLMNEVEKVFLKHDCKGPEVVSIGISIALSCAMNAPPEIKEELLQYFDFCKQKLMN